MEHIDSEERSLWRPWNPWSPHTPKIPWKPWSPHTPKIPWKPWSPHTPKIPWKPWSPHQVAPADVAPSHHEAVPLLSPPPRKVSNQDSFRCHVFPSSRHIRYVLRGVLLSQVNDLTSLYAVRGQLHNSIKKVLRRSDVVSG